MSLADVLGTVAAERKTPKGESKHYIPFKKTEWDEIEVAFGRELKPNDLKLLLLAIARDKITLAKAEGAVAAEAAKPAA